MEFADNSFVQVASLLAAFYALHLVLKRNQIDRIKIAQIERERTSLQELKAELEFNLDLCSRLIDGNINSSGRHENWRTDVIRRYIGDFPLMEEELKHVQRAYEMFEELNRKLAFTERQSIASINRDAMVFLVLSAKPEINTALQVVHNALQEFST